MSLIPDEELEALKQRLDPHELLRWIGYEKSKPHPSGNHVRDFCPIHGGDNQQSLAINLNTGGWDCKSCGAKGGDLIELYLSAKKLPFLEAVRELQQLAGGLPSRDYAKPKISLAKKAEEERRSLEQSRERALEIWITGADMGDASYFENKRVEPPKGIRYGKDDKGNQCALIPLFDIEGRLQSVQYIRKGAPKLFATGTKSSAAFFPLEFDFNTSPTIVYLCEGIATAISVSQALGKGVAVLSCGSAGNIPKVAMAFNKNHPESRIVVCLDDDEAGAKTREGIKALKLPNVFFRLPDFSGIKPRKDEKGKILDKDFNDLHQLKGIDLVIEQLKEKDTDYPNENVGQMEKQTQAPNGLNFRFIQELDPDYFNKEPPPKPVLLSYTKDSDPSGKRHPFLHKEIVALLVGEGGIGKTHIATHLSMCVASGVPFLGKFEIASPGPVCLIVGENNANDIHRLLYKTRAQISTMIHKNEHKEFDKFPTSPNMLKNIDRFVCPFSVHGLDASLVAGDGKPTSFFEDLLKQLKDKEPPEGWQLIILDPASRFAGPGSEKDNAVATAFISRLELISQTLRGNPTILLFHHKSKAATKDGGFQTDGRGVSGISDGVRWMATITKGKDTSDENITVFHLPKTNFTAPIQKFKIKKHFSGVPEFREWVSEKGLK